MAKKTADKFIEYWRENSDIEIFTEFRPQRDEYDRTIDPELPYRKWLESKGYKDFRSDAVILWNDGLSGLTIEFDGSGGHWSHKGDGSERDRQKANQLLRMGFLTARYSVQSLKGAMDYVFDDINDILKVWMV